VTMMAAIAASSRPEPSRRGEVGHASGRAGAPTRRRRAGAAAPERLSGLVVLPRSDVMACENNSTTCIRPSRFGAHTDSQGTPAVHTAGSATGLAPTRPRQHTSVAAFGTPHVLAEVGR
jgi:hypothetical protein